jgi:hypothetical protein
VLTIGRRPSEFAARIQRASSGHTRLVQIGPGDTRLGFSGFDLLISNPQSPLPQRRNVMHLQLPLLYPDPTAIAAASAAWLPRFERLPRPWTAVLIGGSTPPFVLDAAVARRMIVDLERFAGRDGGSLLISTSPRTQGEVAAAVQATVPDNAFLHLWSADALENPHPALLGLADRFIVTADSISMQNEVIRLGKPLAIYPLPRDRKTWHRRSRHLLRSLRWPLRRRPSRRERPGHGERLADQLTRLGITQHRRDFRRFHRHLFATGRAVPFGRPLPPLQPPPPDERPAVARRIALLFHDHSS